MIGHVRICAPEKLVAYHSDNGYERDITIGGKCELTLDSKHSSHLGLTVEEMESYRALKSFVAHMGSVMATKNNENTRRQFDEAVEKLIAFEKEYGITK